MNPTDSMHRVFGDDKDVKGIIDDNRGAEHPNLDIARDAQRLMDDISDCLRTQMVKAGCEHAETLIVVTELRRYLVARLGLARAG